MPFHLTEVEKGRIVALKEEGYSCTACAVKVGRSAKTVRKWWRRYLQDGEEGLKKIKSPGAPRSTTQAEDQAMVAVSLPPLNPLENSCISTYPPAPNFLQDSPLSARRQPTGAVPLFSWGSRPPLVGETHPASMPLERLRGPSERLRGPSERLNGRSL